MGKKIVWEPEILDEHNLRVKVPGGWLVFSGNLKEHKKKGQPMHECFFVVSAQFIHDQHWEWEPIEPYIDPQVEKVKLAKEYDSKH